MKKTTTKKSPTGAPLGNPLKFFREGGEKRKAMFKHGGYNVPKNSLPRKDNGGPGSGMGRMYLDDLANEAMMATPSTPPAPTREKAGPYGNTTPGQIYKKPSYREYGSQNTIPPDTTMKSMIPNPPIPTPGSSGVFKTTPGHMINGPFMKHEMQPLNRNKKGGSVKRKKK